MFQALAAALKDHSLLIVFNAVQALGTLGDQRAIPLLQDLENNPPAGAPRGAVQQTVNEVINHIKNADKTGEKKD